MAEGGVWADPERARQVVDEVKSLKSWLEPYNALRKRLDDARGLAELADAERDDALAHELDTEAAQIAGELEPLELDRKSTRLNSSHSQISYAVFCLKKKNNLHMTQVA